jgi:hypothetical protein
MNNNRNRVGLVAAAVLLGSMGLAGCGGGSDANSAQSAGKGLNDDMVVKFTHCLRKHGVPVADPQPGRPIQILGTPADQDKIQAAQTACKKYAPKGDGQGPGSGADLDRQQALVDCLRAAGVDVEDPVAGQPLRVRSAQNDEAKTQQAMTKCQQKVGAPPPAPAGG